MLKNGIHFYTVVKKITLGKKFKSAREVVVRYFCLDLICLPACVCIFLLKTSSIFWGWLIINEILFAFCHTRRFPPLSTAGVLVQGVTNSIWERISSNGIEANGFSFKYLNICQFEDMNNTSKASRQLSCDISISSILADVRCLQHWGSHAQSQTNSNPLLSSPICCPCCTY